jgi:3-oxoacyl-[acyl-carrier-protein] synthase-3
MNTHNEYVLTSQGERCLQALLRIWFEFERDLGKVPIVQRLQQGRLSIEDYRKLLLNMRQQVIEGSRWITRCASSMDRDYADVRSEVISHAKEEHRDYEMLEQDYVASGGRLEDIQTARRNIGTEALHAFLMHRASQPNPTDLIGAMWIIEGIGNKMASEWAKSVEQHLGQYSLEEHGNINRFMSYHADNDEAHLNKLYALIDRVCQTEEQQTAIESTARVVARLYIMQLEEVDHA